MSAVLGATPYYVLMDGNRRIGPHIVPLDVGIECSSIYGFSDKDPYDRYCLHSQVALTPYPLVKGYLRNQTSAPVDGLKLVVVDAAGPREPYLHAATMEAVLEAHENRMSHVTAAYRLVFDQQAEAYRVEEVSV
jgi:hypothetical protein